MRIIDGLKYSKDHEWIRVEGKMVYIGITDYAQDSLGDIVYVELSESGSILKKDSTFGFVESVKAVSDVLMPLSGTICKINEEIVEDPSLLNKDAFQNWMIYVELDDPEELDQLMSDREYKEYCNE